MTNKEQPRPEPAVGDVVRWNDGDEVTLVDHQPDGTWAGTGRNGTRYKFNPDDYRDSRYQVVRHAPSPKEDDVEVGSRWQHKEYPAWGTATVVSKTSDGAKVTLEWDILKKQACWETQRVREACARLPTEERAPRARQASVDGVTWRDCTEGDDLSMYRYIRTSDGNGWAVRELAAPQPAKPQPCNKVIGGMAGDTLCNRPSGHVGTACGWSFERGPQKRLRDITPEAPAQQPKRATYQPEALAYLAAHRGSDYDRLMERLLVDEGVEPAPFAKCLDLHDMYRQSKVAAAAPPWTPEDPWSDIPNVGEFGDKRPR